MTCRASCNARFVPARARRTPSPSSTSKWHSTQSSTAAYGRPYGNKASRNYIIQPLTKLRDRQSATVHADVKSKQFHLKQGAGRPTQHALMQLTLTILHETTCRKNVEEATMESDLSSTTETRTSPTSCSRTTSFSPAAHSNTRPPRKTTPPHHTHDGRRAPTSPREDKKSSPTRHHKTKNTVAMQGKHIEIQPPDGKIEDLDQPTHHLQRRIRSRTRPPHQMRVCNIREPQTGVDVTTIPTGRQSQDL